jgi:phenylalanyl-tRNA synthetase alpha chain
MASDTDLVEEIRSAPDLSVLEQLRLSALGKSGSITAQLKSLGGMDPDTRAAEAPKIHALREAVSGALAERKAALENAELDRKLATERLDLSLPAPDAPRGSVHPVSQVMDELTEIFADLGFAVAEGPEIEDDWHNFSALNIPETHPARDMHDTFYIAGEGQPRVLRTHTSPVQIRAMEKYPPPLRVVAPGKVHRSDTPDATHSPIFHQVEGLCVDTNITFSDLKGTLDHAMKAFFGSSVKTRFFPSFFPFTEPSADVSISCPFCGGKGCRKCKMSGWIELLGSGMVHPNVFRFVAQKGYDPAKVSGFAFGMGVERIAMMKYGIEDIQLFFQGDVRFLEQFA